MARTAELAITAYFLVYCHYCFPSRLETLSLSTLTCPGSPADPRGRGTLPCSLYPIPYSFAHPEVWSGDRDPPLQVAQMTMPGSDDLAALGRSEPPPAHPLRHMPLSGTRQRFTHTVLAFSCLHGFHALVDMRASRVVQACAPSTLPSTRRRARL